MRSIPQERSDSGNNDPDRSDSGGRATRVGAKRPWDANEIDDARDDDAECFCLPPVLPRSLCLQRGGLDYVGSDQFSIHVPDVNWGTAQEHTVP